MKGLDKVRNNNKWYSSKEFEELYTNEADELGAIWEKEKTVFRLWAPTAEAVTLNLYQSGEKEKQDLLESVPLQRDKKGIWMLEKQGDFSGVYYTYSVRINGGEREACDPYARAVGVNGDRAMVIDLTRTNPEGWETDCNPNAKLSVNDAIIYEAHIRDLTVSGDSGIKEKGKFLGLAEEGTTNSAGNATGLDYIAELGVTHVHFLPIFDFGSVDETKDAGELYNWGYDPKNYFVPEGSYSTNPYDGSVRICELKRMVQAFHRKGLSVVMDVVYNHVNNAETFCFNRVVPGFFSRIGEDGVYSNGSICGNDTASERAMVRRYIVENVLYWATEYHIDGFRFDLVGLLDVETINEIVKRVHEIRPDVIFYGEGWTMGTQVTKEKVALATQNNSHMTEGFAYFSDTMRNLLRGKNTNLEQKGYVNGAALLADSLKYNLQGSPYWAVSPAQVVNYVSCHDDLTLYDKFLSAEPEAERQMLIRYCRLAASIVFASEGIPFLLAGEELLRTKVNEDGTLNSNSYNAGDSMNKISWDCMLDEECRQLKEYYKGLIAFRKEHPVLRLTDANEIRARFSFADVQEGEMVACRVDCSGVPGEKVKALYLIFNPDKKAREFSLPEGKWEIHVKDRVAGILKICEVEDKVVVPEVGSTFLVQR